MSKKLPKIIEREDAIKLLKAINWKTKTGLRNRVAVQLMYRCGLRVQEVCELTPADIDWKRNQLFISESKDTTGKGGKDRWVYADPETMEWIRRWLDVRPESDYLLCTVTKGKEGRKLNQRQLRQFIYGLSKRCGVFIRNGKGMKPISPHVLRHTYATDRLEEGVNIAIIARQLGHENIATTSVYLHARDRERAEMAQNMEPLGI